MASPAVIVIGDVITDIVVRPRGPIAWGSDTRAEIQPMPGGSGPNQAAWLATAGVPTYFIGRVGAMDLDHSEAELRDFGVEPVLAADTELHTGILINVVMPDGERSFLTDRGANRHLARADLPDRLLDHAGLLHVSGYVLFEPGPREAVLDFARVARGRGIRITVDPSSAGFLHEVGAESFLTWTKDMHICFPNAEEAAILTGATTSEDQVGMLARHYDLVVVKNGSLGAIAGNARGERWQAAASASQVVDTTGAGDALFAGFASAYLRNESVSVCLEEGVASGTRSTAFLGGRPPRPYRSES